MCRICIALTLSFLSSCAFASSPSYHELKAMPFGGVGGWDALSVEPNSKRLFVTHADRVVALDLQSSAPVREISGTLGVHGVAIAAELSKLYTSNGKDNSVSVVDLKTLATIEKVKVGLKPDAIVYDDKQKKVFAFNADSNSASVISAQTDKVIVTVKLPGKPEFAVVDEARHQVYVNMEDTRSIAVVDTIDSKVVATWKLEGCEVPTGIALDQEHGRIFAACENAKMVMVDSRSGKVLTSIVTGQGSDGAAYDPELRLAFCPNGKDGTVTIASEKSPNELVVVQTLKTAIGARTIALDEKSHRIFLPTAKFEPRTGQERPRAIKDTQTVLSYGP